jgi:inosine-uridine nucleoside N-ribohydrolase
MIRREFLAAGLAPPVTAQLTDSARSHLLELPAPGRRDAVIDTDTYNEIDDQYAVAYALLSPQRLNVQAVYAAPFRNERSRSAGDGMEKSYEELRRILKFLKLPADGFAFRGSSRFLAAANQPVDSPAARDLIAKALQPRTSPLYVLTLGCPANVSSALLLEPKIKENLVVVWLGGTTHEWPSAREFNLQQDLWASQVLFDSGVALVQIPTKNVSEHLRTTIPEMERWMKGRSALGDYLFRQFVEYHQFEAGKNGPRYPWSKVIWDISVIAWMLEPKWVPSQLVPSPVLTADFRWRAEPGRHSIRVATDCRRDPIFFDLFEKLAGTAP